MSYICGSCQKVQGDGSKPERIPVQTREVKHPNGGTRTEIVKELNVCPLCVSRFKPPVAAKLS